MNSEEKISRLFKEKDLCYEYDICADGTVEITVDLGDWKHDHGYIDWLMVQEGFRKTGETVTFEDGSDCYSSVHFYKEKNG